jgi:hypothetical protein
VDLADVLLAEKLVLGLEVLPPEQLDRRDAAPLVDGIPMPDGLFDLGDLLMIQRKALGLEVF